jgi:hypothetical protein
MADNLPPSSADATESGILNLPEPSGPHRPVMGLLYLLPLFYYILISHDEGNIISSRNVVVRTIVIFAMFKMKLECKYKDLFVFK